MCPEINSTEGLEKRLVNNSWKSVVIGNYCGDSRGYGHRNWEFG